MPCMNVNLRQRRKLYQRGRAGEDYFRDFILGKRDISRSVLTSFLLFVECANSAGCRMSCVTIPRLNRILRNCGFSQPAARKGVRTGL